MHLVHKSNNYYLLRAYYVLGIILGTGQEEIVPAHTEVYIPWLPQVVHWVLDFSQ